MSSINTAFGTITNSGIKAEKKDAKANPTPNKLQNKDPQSPFKPMGDTFEKKSTHILDQDYAKVQIVGNDTVNSGDHAKDPRICWSMRDQPGSPDAKDTFTMDNRKGLKNDEMVLRTDKEDTVKLQGKGWKRTTGVTDEASAKEHIKDPEKNDVLTGDLYEDNNGNKILVEGGAKVETEEGLVNQDQSNMDDLNKNNKR